MPRTVMKRPRDAFDSSPASSTPPQPPAKRFHHLDSDAFSDASMFHLPSDSPSNPFGRIRPFAPRDLPPPTPVADHLVLRFQLGQQSHSVFRIVAVPANYTFWHLHRLSQFLFGWKDVRKEKSPHNRTIRVERRVEHIFTVQKRVVFYASAKHAGLFKNGKSVLHVTGNLEEIRPKCKDDVPWEREEHYTLGHLWHRPGSNTDVGRAVIYEYDVFSVHKEALYISLYSDSDKIKALLPDTDESSNVPTVVLGSGLANDDDDDEDFPLDLQQFNEPHAFESFVLSQEDTNEEQDDGCPDSIRLAEEQARVKKRMSAPLPRRLPVDEDEHDDVEEDVPSKIQMLTNEVTSINDLKKENSKGSVSQVVRLSDLDNSKEDAEGSPDEYQLSPVKKGSEPPSSHLPDPEESCEIGADRKAARFAPRKRVSSHLPDPEESVEVGVNPPQGLSKTAYREACLPDPEESCEVGAYRPDGLVPQWAGRGRTSPKTCLPDADETFNSNASAPRRVLRNRGPSESRDSDSDERRNVAANHNEGPRKRASRVARLPDPDESREIGDERPVARPSRRAKVASRATLRDLAAADDEESEAEV